MQHFQINKGDWPSQIHRCDQAEPTAVKPAEVALLGADTPDLRPDFTCEEGARVAVGQTIFTDRRNPQVAFVSPVEGRILRQIYGPRRSLAACIIQSAPAADPAADPAPQTGPDSNPLTIGDSDAIRKTLLERGMWPAFRTRPFGRTPNPAGEPDAVFVNAVHASPQRPDPAVVLSDRQQDFDTGLSIIGNLTGRKVFICQSPGPALAATGAGFVYASFGGTRASGFPGTHIDLLCPIRPGREVWTIGYQDVAAIGHLFLTGAYCPDRVLSIPSSNSDGYKLVRAPIGTRISDLPGLGGSPETANNSHSNPAHFYSGRFCDHVTRQATLPVNLQSSARRRRGGPPAAIIPTRALERALAVDILPVPLLRALSIGDSEAAGRLGCLSLVEEDVQALSRACTSGSDYSALLRSVLNDLEAEAR